MNEIERMMRQRALELAVGSIHADIPDAAFTVRSAESFYAFMSGEKAPKVKRAYRKSKAVAVPKATAVKKGKRRKYTKRSDYWTAAKGGDRGE